MRRARGLVELSRRDFCAFAAGAVLVGCTNPTSPITTGGIGGGGGDDDSPDASAGEDAAGHDAGHIDAGVTIDAPAPTCPSSGVTDVGAPSTFQLNTPVYFSTKKMFVVRDANGLYALTARCTHEGATCTVQGSDFHCPRHNALFTLNGAVVSGPVNSPLVHYAMCTLAGGHVGVITTMTVSASERLDA